MAIKRLLILIVSLSFLSISSSCYAEIMVNFGQVVTLTPDQSQAGDSQQALSFYKTDNKQIVALTNRVIVKLDTLELPVSIASHPAVDKAEKLAEIAKQSFYLLYLKKNHHPIKISQQLPLLPEVLYAQPDVLQIKHKADASVDSLWQNRLAAPVTGDAAPYIKALDLENMWRKTKGEGVKIAIIDDGFDLKHADLQHIKVDFSYDTQTRTLDASPQYAIDSHGTKVAGIIFAKHNHQGIDGISPNASLIAIRQANTWTSQTLLAFNVARLAGADLVNCSWHSSWLLQPVAEMITELAENGRDGKGIAVVFSAGNQGKEIAALSTEAAIEAAIVVGAADENHQPLTFSNYGKSVDIFNYGRASQSTLVKGGFTPFSGTSLAAAITSGYIALILAQDQAMTLAQIQQTLTKVTAP